MSALKTGTLCVIVAGCPENLGLVVEVVQHLGFYPPREDAYRIKTVTGRRFPQFRDEASGQLISGYSVLAITDRHKLRPLVDPKDEVDDAEGVEKSETEPQPELVERQA